MPFCRAISMDCFLQFSIFQFTMNVLRYYPLALAMFLLLWVWKKRDWIGYRIQQRWPSSGRVWYEVAFSMSTLAVFTGVALASFVLWRAGWLRVYFKFDHFGIAYLIFSFVLLCLWQETWFYWMHRVVHHPGLFKRVHLVHHKSINPSPFTAYSFHPAEALLEAIYIPIFAMLIPVHPFVIIAQTIYAMILNIWFHSGYEILPTGWTRGWFSRWVNTSTHHNMHHSHVNCNYSLYFNFWDRICNTNHPEYDAYFEQVVQNRKRHTHGAAPGDTEVVEDCAAR